MIEFLNAYRVDAQHITSVFLALAVWRWGGGPERWLTGIFVATMVVPVYLLRGAGLGLPTAGPDAWLYFGIDLVAMAGFGLVALNANRNYPLWVAGFQLVAVGAHMIKGMVEGVSLFALVILIVGPSYCQLLVLIAGFVRHVRREKRFGTYRDWRVARPRAALFQT
ncbi:MAG: hypothetical protein RSE14_12185 [Erythrobacter sp.]|jgi:hypothetical protein|uniref:hypothetical protein n=1 Tax=Erythrobacter sp. TaxID=1042 RepID=UPI002B46744A|nr:hypothetical protein [Erythrobacter sp.]WRH70025.1 MAG: hypothetical protein RSE14_12185 [Erythrobacter sp.]